MLSSDFISCLIMQWKVHCFLDDLLLVNSWEFMWLWLGKKKKELRINIEQGIVSKHQKTSVLKFSVVPQILLKILIPILFLWNTSFISLTGCSKITDFLSLVSDMFVETPGGDDGKNKMDGIHQGKCLCPGLHSQLVEM